MCSISKSCRVHTGRFKGSLRMPFPSQLIFKHFNVICGKILAKLICWHPNLGSWGNPGFATGHETSADDNIRGNHQVISQQGKLFMMDLCLCILIDFNHYGSFTLHGTWNGNGNGTGNGTGTWEVGMKPIGPHSRSLPHSQSRCSV